MVVLQAAFDISSGGAAALSMFPIPPHLVVQAGSTVEPVYNGADGRAWGYLINA